MQPSCTYSTAHGSKIVSNEVVRQKRNKDYQDAFLMPGIIPSFASSRKHVRHSPKSLIKPRFRPHLKQRFTNRDENFGGLLLLAIVDVFAIP